MNEDFYIEKYNEVRTEIKSLAKKVDSLLLLSDNSRIRVSEEFANLKLSYRHLEDASMRMGKAIQAADGGVSVYDPATTVGCD